MSSRKPHLRTGDKLTNGGSCFSISSGSQPKQRSDDISPRWDPIDGDGPCMSIVSMSFCRVSPSKRTVCVASRCVFHHLWEFQKASVVELKWWLRWFRPFKLDKCATGGMDLLNKRRYLTCTKIKDVKIKPSLELGTFTNICSLKGALMFECLKLLLPCLDALYRGMAPISLNILLLITWKMFGLNDIVK